MIRGHQPPAQANQLPAQANQRPAQTTNLSIPSACGEGACILKAIYSFGKLLMFVLYSPSYSVGALDKNCWGASAAKVLTVSEAKEFFKWTAPIALPRKLKKVMEVMIVPTVYRNLVADGAQ